MIPTRAPRARLRTLVATADKVHNARTIADDYATLGDALWARFNGGKESTKWYYRTMVAQLAKAWPENPLLPALREQVARFA